MRLYQKIPRTEYQRRPLAVAEQLLPGLLQ